MLNRFDGTGAVGIGYADKDAVPLTIDDKSASHEDMADRPCPICGSADESHVYSDAHFDLARLDEFAFASRKIPEYMHYRLITCPVCDLLYASPAPVLRLLHERTTTPASTAARRLATPAALTPGTSLRSSTSFPTKTEQSTSAPEMVRSSASYSPLGSLTSLASSRRPHPYPLPRTMSES